MYIGEPRFLFRRSSHRLACCRSLGTLFIGENFCGNLYTYKAHVFLVTLLLSLGRSGGVNVSFRLNEFVGKIIAVYAMVVRALSPRYSYNSSEGNPASLKMARCVSGRIRSMFLHSDLSQALQEFLQ